MRKLFETKYGYFSDDGREYVIKRFDTPRPWVNVISNGDYGTVVSQTGSGYSFRGNSNLCRLNTWLQDLIKDDYGKFVYIKDENSKRVWSAGWMPTRADFSFYEVRHGLGYSVIRNRIYGVECEMTQFVPMDEPAEVWKLTLKNRTSRKRTLSLFTYFELCLGNPSLVHREYHKTFIGTEYDANLKAIFADKRREVNRKIDDKSLNEWPCRIFHSSSINPKGYEGDKENFMGNYGRISMPKAVSESRLTKTTGRWFDPVCSLHLGVKLPPGGEKTICFTLGETKNKREAAGIIRKYRNVKKADEELEKVKRHWDKLLSGTTVETPDKALNIMANIWLKYQAISCRLWARCAYYQSSGAFGFRDQLQDSQIFFYLKPEKAKEQILLNAAHQYRSGTVYHWWHTLTEWGLDTGFSDDLLWLPFITLNYLDETADWGILDEEAGYIDGPKEDLWSHCVRAVKKTLSRFSKRGLPLIGEGDWNDGMSSVGINWKGESVWLAHFLYGILDRLEKVANRRRDVKSEALFRSRKKKLKRAVNKYCWDGKWYIRAVSDNGKVLGTNRAKEGKIFLNAQTWSVINRTAEGERGRIAMDSAEKYLDAEYGPLLFYPAYSVPDPEIGYLTRYAAGIRENGGVYSHAATWAIMAECILGRSGKAYSMIRKMMPPVRGMKPDLYKGEPYVSPGNVDGPASAFFGRGSWTWYTGSAAWMFRVITEWILGIRPSEDGLIVDPSVPKEWRYFRARRLFRGKVYEIEARRKKGKKGFEIKQTIVDGNK